MITIHEEDLCNRMLTEAGITKYNHKPGETGDVEMMPLPSRIAILILEGKANSIRLKEIESQKPLVNETTRSTILSNVDRASILDTAKSHVTKDRAATHGDAEKSFETIAGDWNQYFDSRCCDGNVSKLTGYDVAMMMTLFKVARTHNNPAHADNYIDLAGYTACAGEIGCKP